MNKVISLKAIREAKHHEHSDPIYQNKVAGMNKLELLEEMMRFQEERTQEGELTLSLMIRGQILFETLEAQAATLELRELATAYRRHLKLELQELTRHL
jgi:hypothetical protein